MFCVYWVERSPAHTRRWISVGIMLGQRQRWWPALVQHWVNVVFARSVDKCFTPKLNDKLFLIHSLYCPQEPFNNMITVITKAIDTTSIGYQPPVFCSQKTRPF